MLFLAIVLSLVGAVTGLIVPLITGQLIDNFAADSFNIRTVGFLAVLFLLEAVASGLSYMLAYVGNQTVNKIRKRLWTKVLALPVPFFDKHRSAETMSRVTNDTNEVKTLITDHLIAFARIC